MNQASRQGNYGNHSNLRYLYVHCSYKLGICTQDTIQDHQEELDKYVLSIKGNTAQRHIVPPAYLCLPTRLPTTSDDGTEGRNPPASNNYLDMLETVPDPAKLTLLQSIVYSICA